MGKRGQRKARHRARQKYSFKWRLLAWAGVVYLAVALLLVAPLRFIHPPVTAFMLQQTTGGQRHYRWVPLENVSPYMALAVIASEDQRFLVHDGVDLGAIQKALDEDNGTVRGASTITQQLVKNLYLWPGRSLLRKGVEAVFAVTFDALLPKRRILELYLNVVEFGPGIYGVAAASERFFGKVPERLTAAEAALLVTVLPNPAVYSVNAPSAYMRDRQRWVLEQMKRLEHEDLPGQIGFAGRL